MLLDRTMREWVEECRARVSDDNEIDWYSCLDCPYSDLCNFLTRGGAVGEFEGWET